MLCWLWVIFFWFHPNWLPFWILQADYVESEIVVTKNFTLDQTLVAFDINGLVKCASSIWPKLLVHANIFSRPMTSPLVLFEYVHFLPDWAPLFDKLKRALTCALFIMWMYSIWFQLTTFHCCYTIESWASLFDKLLRALTSFDLSSTFQLNMEWLMLHKLYSLGITCIQPGMIVPLFFSFLFISFISFCI